MFVEKLSDESLEERKFGYNAPTYLVPAQSLIKADIRVFLHDMRGDKRKKERQNVFLQYSGLVSDEIEDFTSDFGLSFRFLWFFDADDKGINLRMDEISHQITELTNSSLNLSIGLVNEPRNRS